MLNSDNIVFISNEFDNEQSSKIAHILNAHEIKTTTDISAATIVIIPAKEPLLQHRNNNLAVNVFFLETNKEEVLQLLYERMEQLMPQFEIPDIKSFMNTHVKKREHHKFIKNKNLGKLNKIQQRHKQILFNRTRHK